MLASHCRRFYSPVNCSQFSSQLCIAHLLSLWFLILRGSLSQSAVCEKHEASYLLFLEGRWYWEWMWPIICLSRRKMRILCHLITYSVASHWKTLQVLSCANCLAAHFRSMWKSIVRHASTVNLLFQELFKFGWKRHWTGCNKFVRHCGRLRNGQNGVDMFNLHCSSTKKEALWKSWW